LFVDSASGRGSLRPPAASRCSARKLATRSFPRRPPAYELNRHASARGAQTLRKRSYTTGEPSGCPKHPSQGIRTFEPRGSRLLRTYLSSRAKSRDPLPTSRRGSPLLPTICHPERSRGIRHLEQSRFAAPPNHLSSRAKSRDPHLRASRFAAPSNLVVIPSEVEGSASFERRGSPLFSTICHPERSRGIRFLLPLNSTLGAYPRGPPAT
jgi:hypothetical protein